VSGVSDSNATHRKIGDTVQIQHNCYSIDGTWAYRGDEGTIVAETAPGVVLIRLRR